jgi:predicted DNA-binding transcriptional regulator AlpA
MEQESTMLESTVTMNTTTQYVPWNEGANILGIGRSSFFYLVESGQISTEPGRGPRDGRYSLEDIQRIAAQRATGRRRKASHRRIHPTPIIIDWLSPKDIPAILRLDQIVYDEIFLAEMERYQQWSEKNGQLAIAAFDAKSNRQTMLAYIACLPLEESVILQVMRGEREEISITQDEMQTYERPGPYTLLANSAVIHPEHPYLLRRVLQSMINAWIERFPKQYISRVYAQSVSERGDLLISNFFMQPRYDLANNAYMLDLTRPARSKMFRAFQDALKAKDPLKYKEIYQTGEK